MLNGVAETCLYATNLSETGEFYSEVLDLPIVMKEDGRHYFFKCGDSMLLLFNSDHTLYNQTDVDGKPVPLHGATGPVHVVFSVDPGNFKNITKHLKEHNVAIESEISWPNKSRSLYFRDPAGNSLEVITSDMWN